MSELKISDLSTVPEVPGFYAVGVQDGDTKKYKFGDMVESGKHAIASCGIQEFSPDLTYNVGSYALYNGEAYRFTATHHPGSWSTSDTRKVTAFSEIIKKINSRYTQSTTITLTSDDSSFTKSGRHITATTASGDIYQETTDSSGKVVFDIERNNLSTVTSESITGYTKSNDFKVGSNSDSRDLYIRYYKNKTYRTINIGFTINFTPDEVNDVSISEDFAKTLLIFFDNSAYDSTGYGEFYNLPLTIDGSTVSASFEVPEGNDIYGKIYFPQLTQYSLDSISGTGVTVDASDSYLITFGPSTNTITVSYTHDVPLNTGVSYMTSTGTQYINLGIPGNNNQYKFKFKFKYSTYVSGGYIFGNYLNNDTNATRMYISGSSSSTSGPFNINTKASSPFTITAGLVTKDTDHIVEISQTGQVIFDGNVIGSPTITTGTANAGDIVLFGSKNPTTGVITYSTIGLSIYYFEVYQGSTLYKRYVPKATSLGIGCMYEEVEEKYYYNKGTGNFTIV